MKRILVFVLLILISMLSQAGQAKYFGDGAIEPDEVQNAFIANGIVALIHDCATGVEIDFDKVKVTGKGVEAIYPNGMELY